MKYNSVRVAVCSVLLMGSLFCFSGNGLAQQSALPPQLQSQVDVILLLENDNNALDLVRLLIQDNEEHRAEIAQAASELRPDLAALITAMLDNGSAASLDSRNCPSSATGQALSGCSREGPVASRRVAFSAILPQTLENPSVVSPSQ